MTRKIVYAAVIVLCLISVVAAKFWLVTASILYHISHGSSQSCATYTVPVPARYYARRYPSQTGDDVVLTTGSSHIKALIWIQAEKSGQTDSNLQRVSYDQYIGTICKGYGSTVVGEKVVPGAFGPVRCARLQSAPDAFIWCTTEDYRFTATYRGIEEKIPEFYEIIRDVRKN